MANMELKDMSVAEYHGGYYQIVIRLGQEHRGSNYFDTTVIKKNISMVDLGRTLKLLGERIMSLSD